MHLRNSDLLLVTGIAALYTAMALLPTPSPIYSAVGLVFALPMVFFVPGYALTAMLAHRRVLDGSHRLLLSLGLSLALDIVCGFLLNLLPMGLRTLSWVLLLSGLTVLFALLVIYLRRGLVPVLRQSDNPATPRVTLPRATLISRGIRGAILCGFALTLTLSALLYAMQGVAHQPHPSFTQLWMLPPARVGTRCAVQVGLRSFEATTVTFNVVTTLNAAQVTAWPALVIAPNQAWQQTLSVAPVKSAQRTLVVVKLYKQSKPDTVYREVHMTLPAMCT